MEKVPHDTFVTTYNNLPEAVRTYLAGDDLGMLVKNIGFKYNLHIDILGVLNRTITYMLMGFINPTQFMQELRAAGITEKDAASVGEDVNERVFKPLQGKLRTEGENLSVIASVPSENRPAVGVPTPLNSLPAPHNAPAALEPASVLQMPVLQEPPIPALKIPESPRAPLPSEERSPITSPQLEPKAPPPLTKEYAVDPYREMPE